MPYSTKEKHAAHSKKYRDANPMRVKAWVDKSKRGIRMAAYQHYSGEVPFCACCGETTWEFLCIDHIEGNGRKHRMTIGGDIAPWLKKNGYPSGFQVLCHNCNMAKGMYGECPHKTKEYNVVDTPRNFGQESRAAKLTDSDVLAIQELYSQKQGSYRELAKRFSVSYTTIAHVVNHASWKHVRRSKHPILNGTEDG